MKVKCLILNRAVSIELLNNSVLVSSGISARPLKCAREPRALSKISGASGFHYQLVN